MGVLDKGDMLLISCSEVTQSSARAVLLQHVEAMVEILRKRMFFFSDDFLKLTKCQTDRILIFLQSLFYPGYTVKVVIPEIYKLNSKEMLK